MFKSKGYKVVKEKKLKNPFRGYIILPEGKYATNVYVKEITRKTGLLGKEEQYIEYTVAPDMHIPYPYKDSTVAKPMVGYLVYERVECEGFKQALRIVTDKILDERDKYGVLGWDRDVDWSKMELNKDLY